MNTKTKVLLALASGILLGAGGQVMAARHLNVKSQVAPPQVPQAKNHSEDIMEQAWREFDHSMSEERQAMQKLFAAQVPDLDSSWPSQASEAQINQQKDKMVIRVPIEDPHHKIQVDVKDGFLTVSEQARSQDKQSESSFNSVQSFSISSGYDPGKMTQNIDGNTLVISIPRAQI